MKSRWEFYLIIVVSPSTVLVGQSAELEASRPRVLIDGWRIELVASAPDIVTPVAVTFDHRGRLLVIESHTHFRPEGYAGPEFDRIRALADSGGDGRLDHWSTFYEGSKATMGLAAGPADSIYVATRDAVFRLRDLDGDGAADERLPIAKLHTENDYPHNGLGGLTYDAETARLYIGLAENHGAEHRLVGSDGKEFSGRGEGGVFRCREDGSGMERFAIGLWNPFSICLAFDGRVFAVDNDPGWSPPCRLLDVMEGGDYGFRYFRMEGSRRHPLLAWNGELPGTLPMICGTGEAPSAVVPYRGRLWVTS
jgi:putative membrane-bound dehydrogenase-like protein